VLQSPRGETPEQRRQRLQAEAQYGARQAIDGDPLVQRILNEFEGFVLDDTVRPVS
jgi:DNA polymerase-3 subunit gamma/tau